MKASDNKDSVPLVKIKYVNLASDNGFLMGTIKLANGGKFNMSDALTTKIIADLEFEIVNYMRQELGKVDY